jgi:hypothetical protein
MRAGVGWSVAALPAAVAMALEQAALAAGVGRQRATSMAMRTASARVERFGLSYPPHVWRAACDARAGGGWRCAVGAGGQCSGLVTILRPTHARQAACQPPGAVAAGLYRART